MPEECHSVGCISQLSFGAKIYTSSASGLFFAPKLTLLGGFSCPPATAVLVLLRLPTTQLHLFLSRLFHELKLMGLRGAALAPGSLAAMS